VNFVFEQIRTGGDRNFAYLVGDPGSGEAAVVDPGIPKINGQDKDYLVMALRAYRDDRREGTAMHRMSLPYSDAVIESIAASGSKIVMTTHDLGQARRLADEVVFLVHGKLREHTPADAFFEAPRSEEGRAFLRGELLW